MPSYSQGRVEIPAERGVVVLGIPVAQVVGTVARRPTSCFFVGGTGLKAKNLQAYLILETSLFRETKGGSSLEEGLDGRVPPKNGPPKNGGASGGV